MLELHTGAADDGDLEPYPFKIDGQVMHLPNARSLTGRQAARIQSDLDGVLTEVADAEVVDAILDLRTDKIEELATAWITHAREGASESGKSSTSSESSPTTARPSRRTSRSAASKATR